MYQHLMQRKAANGVISMAKAKVMAKAIGGNGSGS